jgi:hypothetical protein
MKYLVLALACTLTGCATPPAFLANYYDRRDPCQSQEFSKFDGTRLKPQGYSHQHMPAWCGAAQGRTRIMNTHGQTLGYIR